MIDYGPFKLIYMCVHIDRICQFEQFIIVTVQLSLSTNYTFLDEIVRPIQSI